MNFLLLIFIALFQMNCGPKAIDTTATVTQTVITNEVDFWLTKANKSVLLEKQNTILGFGITANNYSNIEVDENQKYQTMDGFGFSLTGGSAQVIRSLSALKKQALLQELFGVTNNAIGISYLRISIGASDLDPAPFSYNDLNTGQTDPSLTNFNLSQDTIHLIPLLKEILAINPLIKIMASPWSAPVWMKDNNSTKAGSLQPMYYQTYAQYFVKYIQKMKAQGITIDAVTPQNEPLNPGNNPCMIMTAAEQANFVKNNLGPSFQTANLSTKIVIYDHNCDRLDYPMSILADNTAKPFVDGTAFHLYAGDISVLSTVHNSFPDKNLYFTEQYTASNGTFDGDLKWHIKNVIIGATRNWSKNALEWNLANDPYFGPHTQGGCSTCLGAITINTADTYTKNVGYYIVAHASKFVPFGSIRIASNNTGNLYNVAFKTPAGNKVLIVENDGTAPEMFNIKYNGKWVTSYLEAGSVGTYIW